MAVHAQTDGNFAVFASAPKGFSVFGEGPYGVSGQSKSKSGIGVFVRGPADGYAGYFEGNVLIKGNLTKTGVGCAVAVPFPDKSFRQLCSIESPESWFEDFGEARLVKGKAEVKIDPDFAKTVNLKTRYYVFVTPHSTKISGLAVVSRMPGGFRVEDSTGGTVRSATALSPARTFVCVVFKELKCRPYRQWSRHRAGDPATEAASAHQYPRQAPSWIVKCGSPHKLSGFLP